MEPTSSPPGTGPRVHVLTVRRGVATCSDRVLVQGSALDDVVAPDLDAPWEGLAVSATLSDGTESYTPPRRDDGSWLVPWELTRRSGAVTVSLEGTDGDGRVARTARMVAPLVVLPSDAVGGEAPGEPTVSEWRAAYERALSARCDSVVAETLPAGAKATATFSDHELSLGLPRGERGAGVVTYPGDHVTTGAVEGDIAINPDTGDVFVWSDEE